jgi:Transposase DDE domain
MSDSRRVYRAIKQAVKQLYPSEPQGNVARHLNTLAGMVTGIVLGKSCQLPTLAGKAPDDSLAESRSKRFSRWLQNETVTAETYFLPFIQALLMNLAQARPLVFIMDGSEVGHGCLALVISVVYGQRALPIAWVVVRGSKGHFPADTHVRLLREVVARMPFSATAQFLGDGEFDSPQLQQALDACAWSYVCRTAKNTRIQRDGEWVGLASIEVHRGRKKMWSAVRFTQAGYGPVQVIGWWDSACDEPLYLVTNLTDRDEACRCYQKRMLIETLFSDQKSRGFRLNQSHLRDPERLSRLLIAACLAYWWIIYLGTLASQPHWRRLVHRADRCDLSFFQLGLRLLHFWLDDDAPLRIAFLPQAARTQTFVLNSVR